MNNDIVFVKRKSGVKNSKMYNLPMIKLEFPQGRFTISKKLAEILQVKEDDGLMFGFNQSAKTAYVLKDNEEDAFIIRSKDKNSFRFCSKDLQMFFTDTFDLLETGKSTFYFKMDMTAYKKGMHQLTWEGEL
jgi:hypothetical protein